MVSFLDKLFGKKKDSLDELLAPQVNAAGPEDAMADTPAPKKVTITGINLKFMGGSHQIKGMEVSSKVFDLRIPFSNKMGNNTLPDNLKGPKMVLSRITVEPPFKLVEVNTQLPVEVEYMSKVVFNLKIEAPDMNWEGPMSVAFGNEATNNVTISIKKVTLHQADKSAELEESGVTTSMQKSQLFKQNIQLYKIASFGDTINKIEVSKPFDLVSTDPKLPITADKKDSYIVSLYMKCPEHSYAGDLDITFS